MQIFILYWGYLMKILKKTEKNTKTPIYLIREYESGSTLNFMLVSGWKILFLFFTEFLGFLILEGCFLTIFDSVLDDIFSTLSSIIIILEIISMMILQELFWNQSLQYIPQLLNQINQPTVLVLYVKIIKIVTLCIFVSQLAYKSILVLGISIFNSLYELYIQLVLKVRFDHNIIKLNVFMQSLIFCVSIQQIFVDISNTNLEFLWLIVTILLYKLISIIYLTDSIQFLESDKQSEGYFEQGLLNSKQRVYQYQILQQKRDSQYRLINKILLSKHQKACQDGSCICKNREKMIMKMENLILEEQIQRFKMQIKLTQLQPLLFYLQYIQLLLLYNMLFEALSITQKILNSFKRKNQSFKLIQIIKGQISSQHKMLFKLLQQQIMMTIEFSIQSKSQSTKKANVIIKQAIRSLQQKINSEKAIQSKFNKIVKQKISLLEELSNSSNLQVEFINNEALKIISEVELLKQQLMQNFRQIPTNTNKSLLLFFQIEILNDLINSQTINTMNTQMNNQEEILFANNIYSELANKYSHAVFIIQDENNIDMISNNVENKLQIGLNIYRTLEDLVPSFLIQYHKQFLRDFFQSGLNKYYLNISQSFLKISTGVISPIDMCMDISFDLSMNQLLTIAFIKEDSSAAQTHFIIIDSEFKIKEITQNLYYKILGYPINSKMALLDLSIFNVIHQLKQDDFVQKRTLGYYQLAFPFNINRLNSNSVKIAQKSQDYYQGEIHLKPRMINNKIIYYIIEISDFKSEKQKLIESVTIHQRDIDIDENEIINIPLEIEFFREADCQINYQHITSPLDYKRSLLQDSLQDPIYFQFETNNKVQYQDKNSIQSDKDEKMEKFQEQFDDANSQISSVAAIRRSIFYKQYQVLNDLIFSNIFPPNIKIFNVNYIIYIIISAINLILLLEQVGTLQKYQDLIVLLRIKYDIYEPIESFLNTRYTIVALNQALSAKIVKQEEYDNLVIFPRSNLAKGYDDLKLNIMDVIQKREFQSFLKDKYIDGNWYTSSNNGSKRNTTFRSAILAMLNYQYEYKLAYTIRPLRTDSAYSYYSYKNYIQIFGMFTQFNQDILLELAQQIKDQQSQLKFINVAFNLSLFFISIIYSLWLIKQRRLKNKLLSLLLQQDKDVMFSEVQRLGLLLTQINTNYNYLCQYKLEIQTFDEKLKVNEKEFSNLVNKKGKNTQSLRRNRQAVVYNFFQLGFILTNFIFLMLINIFTINSINNYLFKQNNTGQIYSSLSNTGVNVLIIYAQREVLYWIASFPFLSTQDVQDIRDQIDESLSQIQIFNQQFLLVNKDEYLLDDDSFQLFQDLSTQPMCKFLPAKYDNVSQSLCPFVLNGILNKGLIATLNLMQTSVYTEKQVNNFKSRTIAQVPLKELEGATFTTLVIKELVNKLDENLFNYSLALQSSFTIIYACCIAFQLIFGLCVILKVSNYEMQQINDLRKIVYLLPQSSLIFDDSFQRQIRIIITNEQLT